MPGMCSVPGCKARSRGVVFHSLPTRDPQRCRKWLQAIKGPRFDENTPTSKYGNIRVCSQHFKPEDYEPDIQAEFMKTTLWKILKSKVIPTVFSGRQHEDRVPLHLHRRLPWVSKVLLWMLHRLLPPCQLLLPQSSSPATSQSDKNTEKDLSQSKTIVNDSCLMELFKKCQTCGQPITKKKVTHCGAQKKVRWSCLGGHRGMWMSSPYLWVAFPEIHLLTALSILFSGGTFAHFKKCAKHLHLNFMGHKTFFEIQKAYLNPEIKQMKRTEQGGIIANDDHQQPGGSLPYISDPLKKIIAKSRRRERGALWSR